MKVENIFLQLDSSISKRKDAANIILKDHIILKETIALISSHEKNLSLKALMAIEMLSRNNFQAIQAYSSELIHSGKIYLDSSSRRYLSKIYGQAIKANFDNTSSFCLASELKKEIIELSFLWLISNEKTAVKVFSMQNIFDLRLEKPWITEELKGVIEKEFPNSSQGFKPTATKILRKMKL